MSGLPSASNSIPNGMVLAEGSTQQNNASASLELVQGDSNGDSAISSEEQIQHEHTDEVSHSTNASIPEPEIVNLANENHNDNVTALSEDEEQNYRSEEQRYIPESLSLVPIESNFQADQKNDALQDIQDTNQTSRDSKPENENKEFSEVITSFLEAVYDILECPVCLNHMVPPILLCASGHSICSKCRPLMTQCPLCRKSFLQSRNVALEAITRKLGFKCTHKECQNGCFNIKESPEQQLSVDHVTYTCPLMSFTNCFWKGNYSDIRSHMEERHESNILTGINYHYWEIKLVIRDFKVIFTFDEIFFYKQHLDVIDRKFYIKVFCLGQRENHNKFEYGLEICSRRGKETFKVYNNTFPLLYLESTCSYTTNYGIVLDYYTVGRMSVHGDLKCKLVLKKR